VGYLQPPVTFTRVFAILPIINPVRKLVMMISEFRFPEPFGRTNLFVIGGRVTNIRKLKLYLRTFLMKKELLSQTRRCFI